VSPNCCECVAGWMAPVPALPLALRAGYKRQRFYPHTAVSSRGWEGVRMLDEAAEVSWCGGHRGPNHNRLLVIVLSLWSTSLSS
jgi:hypothetical protein